MKWDNAISNATNRLPYALSWFLDIVSPNWNALVADDYKMVMPLPSRKRYGIPYLYQPVLCNQLGVFSTTDDIQVGVNNFIKAIPRKFIIADIAFNTKNLVSDKNNGYQFYTKFSQSLPLNQSYTTLAQHYSKSHQKNIQRFEKKSEYTITDSLSLDNFFTEKAKISEDKKLNFPKQDQIAYFNLLKKLDDKKRLTILTGFDNNQKILGSVGFLLLDFDIVGIQSFSSEEGKKVGVIFSIIDQFIKMNAGTNLTIDFMGSSLPGVRERNLGFGSWESEFTFARLNRIKNIFG
jgi:hypothetical protein